MVSPPVVYTAGLLRALGRGIDTDDWVWHAQQTGQLLFRPPNVSGWPKNRWLDTSTFKGRWETVAGALDPLHIEPGDPRHRYRSTESAARALASALRFCGDPPLSSATKAYLLGFARACTPPPKDSANASAVLAQRQNALRHLILTCPDHQVS
jgi:hypothetical protein